MPFIIVRQHLYFTIGMELSGWKRKQLSSHLESVFAPAVIQLRIDIRKGLNSLCQDLVYSMGPIKAS